MEPLSRVLYSLYRNQPEHGSWVVACLEGAWAGILGEKLSKVCRPVAWDNHRLIIEIQDQEWLESLQGMKGDVLARIREATNNEVREISFR